MQHDNMILSEFWHSESKDLSLSSDYAMSDFYDDIYHSEDESAQKNY
jgi:hypothetical protein